MLCAYPKTSVTNLDQQFKWSRIDENDSSPNNCGKNRNTFLTFRFGLYFGTADAQMCIHFTLACSTTTAELIIKSHRELKQKTHAFYFYAEYFKPLERISDLCSLRLNAYVTFAINLYSLPCDRNKDIRKVFQLIDLRTYSDEQRLYHIIMSLCDRMNTCRCNQSNIHLYIDNKQNAFNLRF